MLHVQQFLRSGNTLAALTATFAVKSTRHRKYNNLVTLKYPMIDSPLGHPLVQECRGLILDENDNWNIVARAFNKFFNYGEGNAAAIDWSTATTFEKIDGSLCLLYHYDNQWHVATTGTPDAGGQINDFDFTFHELFFKTFGNTPLPTDPTKCFFFELTSKYNKIVVQHNEPSLTLLGGRCMLTQQEFTVDTAHNYFPTIKKVQSYSLGSIDQCLATFTTMSPVCQEGYVIVDAKFNRVKLKHPGYIALHHLAGGLRSNKAMVEIVRKGEIDEVCSAFPEYKDDLLSAKQRLDDFITSLETYYDAIKDIELQKEFALQASKSKCSAALFCYRAKKVESIRQYIMDMRIDVLLQLLGYKAEKPVEFVDQ